MLLTAAVLIAFGDPVAAPIEIAKIDAKPKVVCKTITVTGSRLGARKFCAPLSDWADYESKMRDWTGELSEGFRIQPKGGGMADR